MPTSIQMPPNSNQKDIVWQITRLQLSTYLETRNARCFESPKRILFSEADEVTFEAAPIDSALIDSYGRFFDESEPDVTWTSVFDASPFNLVEGKYKAKFATFNRANLANFLVQIINLFQKECTQEFIPHLSEEERRIIFQEQEIQKIFSDILLMYSHCFISTRKFSEDPETHVIYSFCSQLFGEFASISSTVSSFESYCNAVRRKARLVAPFGNEAPYGGMINIAMLREKTEAEAQAAFTDSENLEDSTEHLEKFIAHISQENNKLESFFNNVPQSIAQTTAYISIENALENKLQMLTKELLALLINAFTESFPDPEIFSDGSNNLAERNNLISAEITKPLSELFSLYAKKKTLTAQFCAVIIAEACKLIQTYTSNSSIKDIYRSLKNTYQLQATRRHSFYNIYSNTDNTSNTLTSTVFETILMQSRTNEETLLLINDLFIYFDVIPQKSFIPTIQILLSTIDYLDQGRALYAAATFSNRTNSFLSILTQALCSNKLTNPSLLSFIGKHHIEMLIKNQLSAEEKVKVENEMLLLNSNYLLTEKLYFIGMIAKGKIEASTMDVFSGSSSEPSSNSLYLDFSIFSSIRNPQDVEEIFPHVAQWGSPTKQEITYA